MTSPDPDPSNTPGLEPGGGVAPGDTPPGEASTTEAISHREAEPARFLPYAAIVGVALLVICVVAFFIARAADFL
jgi:cobalamin biosynthesis Mg chelatase CobN